MRPLTRLLVPAVGVALAFLTDPRIAPAHPVLKVAQPGAEPRAVLRYHPRTGALERAAMSMRMAVKAKGQTPPMPPQKGVLEWKSEGSPKPDEIEYGFRVVSMEPVEEPGADPKVLAAMREAYKKSGVERLVGKARMTTRGEVTSLRFDVPAKADATLQALADNLQQSMPQFSAPWLPAEAVGVGASWTVHAAGRMLGATLDMTATYTLKGREGEHLDLDVAVEMHAEPQRLELPNVPGDLNVDLGALTAHGKGTLSVDLGHLAPQRMSLDMTLAERVRMSGRDKDQTVAMDMVMTMTLEPPPAEPAGPAGSKPKK